MTRALVLDEIDDPEPELDLEREPTEPRPRFTFAFHDAVGKCTKGHVFSETRMRLDIAAFFGGDRCMGDDKPAVGYPAYWDHLCPHCAHERHVVERDTVRRRNSTLTTRHLSESKRWAIREAARGGVVPGRKRRAIRL